MTPETQGSLLGGMGFIFKKLMICKIMCIRQYSNSKVTGGTTEL